MPPQTLRGGATTTGTVSLGGLAPSGGATIALSSGSAELMVPSSVIVPAGSTNATFTASASPVETATDVVVTSGYLGTSQTGVVTITPPDLIQFEVSPAILIGGEPATGQATIDSVAAPAGAAIAIVSSDSAVVPPVSLTVPGGTTSGTAALPTNPVAASASVVVSATRNGITLSSVVTVQPAPVSLASLLITSATLVGSNDATGTITLTHPAPPAGLEVELTSSDSSRGSVPSLVVVPAGATQGAFPISTTVVSTATTVTITATMVELLQHTITLEPPQRLLMLEVTSEEHGFCLRMFPAGGVEVNDLRLVSKTPAPVPTTGAGGGTKFDAFDSIAMMRRLCEAFPQLAEIGSTTAPLSDDLRSTHTYLQPGRPDVGVL